jgi:hypothetical protein
MPDKKSAVEEAYEMIKESRKELGPKFVEEQVINCGDENCPFLGRTHYHVKYIPLKLSGLF